MRQLLLIIFLPTLFTSCNSKPVKDAELHNLVTLLIGKFSNKEQVENDTDFSHLNLVNIRIWKDRPGYWIYSEVYSAKENQKIHNQKISHYERMDSSTFKKTIYKISNIKNNTDTNSIGDKKSMINNLEFFDNLSIERLKLETGCHVYFKKKTSTIYSGKTSKKSCYCSSEQLNYSTSSYVVSRDKISIWTKGYNKKGKQVWGNIKGPFKYKKLVDN
ncbi:chromophore lyase CpcT/CpeT [Aquimarina sp. I32.4]|uniref:chromophore lyase CpcT/CpeT n=1 Tax=Aquimarina sp. I32.4 TaxID=2053903 RepID=UPI000CDED67C|nr:chromophore lyase CpcT/CpeT [Aquimarina sp. I32.4]